MSIEENKQVVLDYMAKSGAGDYEGVSALVADDARLWLAGLGLVSKEELLDTWVGVKKLKVESNTQISNITAEGNRVALEWTGNTLRADGSRYANVYHILLFVEDGKIVGMNEYCDTAYLNYLFPGRIKEREIALRPTSDEHWDEVKDIITHRKAQISALT